MESREDVFEGRADVCNGKCAFFSGHEVLLGFAIIIAMRHRNLTIFRYFVKMDSCLI